MRHWQTLFLGVLVIGSASAQSAKYSFDRPANSGSATLRIQLMDGRLVEQNFAEGAELTIGTRLGNGTELGNGVHRYELRFAPQLSTEQRAAAAALRAEDHSELPKNWPTAIEARTGALHIADGLFQPAKLEPGSDQSKSRGDSPLDQVIADDLIVQGSGCFGFDCVDGESFGFDTIRLKENNTRIGFLDTSNAPFPSNDWGLEANESSSIGANAFSIFDITNNRRVFTVTAGAPAASLFVDATGRLGLRTATPEKDVHLSTSNTPTLRLEQTSAGGFSARTWDISANDASFFIRDVSSGGTPLRIRRGAPSNSIDISTNGNIGLGLSLA
jgi:hypothetical protein